MATHTPDYPEPQTPPRAVPHPSPFGLIFVFCHGGTHARELDGGVLNQSSSCWGQPGIFVRHFIPWHSRPSCPQLPGVTDLQLQGPRGWCLPSLPWSAPSRPDPLSCLTLASPWAAHVSLLPSESLLGCNFSTVLTSAQPAHSSGLPAAQGSCHPAT